MLWQDIVSWRTRLEQSIRRAASRAACTAGSNNPTSTPMIAITTRSSTSVKARLLGRIRDMDKPLEKLCILENMTLGVVGRSRPKRVRSKFNYDEASVAFSRSYVSNPREWSFCLFAKEFMDPIRLGSARQAEEANGIAGKTCCHVIKSKWNPHGPLRVSSIASAPTADCETTSGAQLECQSRNRRRGVESMVACQCTKGASRPEQIGTHLQRRGWFAQARLAH